MVMLSGSILSYTISEKDACKKWRVNISRFPYLKLSLNLSLLFHGNVWFLISKLQRGTGGHLYVCKILTGDLYYHFSSSGLFKLLEMCCVDNE